MKTTITFKQINKLAIPALISGVSEPILSLTDAAIVGNIQFNATESLAAVGIVTTFLSMLIWILGQTRSAISSLVSQYLGANNLDAIKTLPAQAILLITSLSIVIIILTYPFAEYIFKLYNASDIILDYSVNYYRIRVFGFPFTLFTIAVFGTFRGLQNTFYPMIIAIVGTVINIVLDVILVYGIEGLLPAMHIEGAGYASVIAQLIMALLSIYYLLVKTTFSLKVSLTLNKEIKTFSLMILNLFVRTLALNITLYYASAFSTSYGKEYIAAYTIAINLWFLGAFIIDGYSSAGNILSGKLFGQENYQALLRLSSKLIKYGIILGISMAIIGGLFYEIIGTVFTKDPKVLHEFYQVFWIILLMQPLCALAFIFDGVFKGLGKMKYLRNVLLFSTFMVFLPLLFWLDSMNYKLYGIFIAFTAWIIARGVPLIIKFRQQFSLLSQKV
ncbi:MAG: MATE family efflux transporter [Flavobacteriaceae bacterium]|nr:MATE family efflux transporter [Bacteroidota bacterium]MDG1380323.1 MATE family efflux transporter [Flavobacteriaceae bacterium]MDG2349517.1 MATE family efflux transporter [Flavobacteriaceae bacterium]